NGARSVLCGGRSVMSVPTAISQMRRANRAFEMSEEFGPLAEHLVTRDFSRKGAYLPLRAAVNARYIEFEPVSAEVFRIFRFRKPNVPQLHNLIVACATALAAVTRSLRRTRSSGVGHSLYARMSPGPYCTVGIPSTSWMILPSPTLPSRPCAPTTADWPEPKVWPSASAATRG